MDERDDILQGFETQHFSSRKWKAITLKNLFGGTKPVSAHSSWTMEEVEEVEEEEEAMMQEMAEAEKDKRPDNGKMEILS